MKNASSLKGKNNIESPKTPGGISKSLLTPCRRVGLSRNWKKTGPSPFISPLSNASSTPEDLKKEPITRKRKKLSPEEDTFTANNVELSCSPDTAQTIEVIKTPKRSVSYKKSKTLQLHEENLEHNANQNNISSDEKSETLTVESMRKKKSASKLSTKCFNNDNIQVSNTSEQCLDKKDDQIIGNDTASPAVHNNTINPINPNNLTKECIVVIQKKIKSAILNKTKQLQLKSDKDVTSQRQFDSDSDDIPLCQLNVQKNNMNNNVNLTITDDCKEGDIFVEKLKHMKTSTRDLDFVSKHKQKQSIKMLNNSNLTKEKPLLQLNNSFDDDGDEFDTKKTILIQKTYKKIAKPVKAKSTGSITDKDIEELKARIETKKQLLLAKALAPETEELRNLIKKWQKGCQDALMELIDLMKKKMPEQNLANSEILQMLNIPSTLVGYDSDNECFNTPNDESVVWASLNI